MNNSLPAFPATVRGYWRPWKESANYWNDYLDYVRDGSLVKYGAETVGKYINQASQEQIEAINKLGQSIGRGINVLSNQMSDINDTLGFLNRNLDIQIEQQKLSNLLLQNIAELLRLPDSEKERQHSIELGIKFFVNAKKDTDLYADALEELLKAESLMKQDFFVLHRIGCIYLHVEQYINPEKALEYFLRAAKYASVESDPNALRLASALTGNFNTTNNSTNISEKEIESLASESYEKAAFSAYILGQFENAVKYQAKALSFESNAKNHFYLSKYLVRIGNIKEAVDTLENALVQMPELMDAIFEELDLINEPLILDFIINKHKEIEIKIDEAINGWNEIKNNTFKENALAKLYILKRDNYPNKIKKFTTYFGDIKFKMKDYESALEKYTEIIDINPFDSKIYIKRGWVFRWLNLKEKAKQDFDKAINLNPQSSSVYIQRGIFYRFDDNDKSMKDFNKAIELDPQNSNAFDMRAWLKYDQRDYSGAILDLNKAFDIQDRLYDFYMVRGDWSFKMKDYNAALNDYNIAIELNPNKAELYDFRANIKLELGDSLGYSEDKAKAKIFGKN